MRRIFNRVLQKVAYTVSGFNKLKRDWVFLAALLYVKIMYNQFAFVFVRISVNQPMNLDRLLPIKKHLKQLEVNHFEMLLT